MNAFCAAYQIHFFKSTPGLNNLTISKAIDLSGLGIKGIEPSIEQEVESVGDIDIAGGLIDDIARESATKGAAAIYVDKPFQFSSSLIPIGDPVGVKRASTVLLRMVSEEPFGMRSKTVPRIYLSTWPHSIIRRCLLLKIEQWMSKGSTALSCGILVAKGLNLLKLCSSRTRFFQSLKFLRLDSMGIMRVADPTYYVLSPCIESFSYL